MSYDGWFLRLDVLLYNGDRFTIAGISKHNNRPLGGEGGATVSRGLGCVDVSE